MKSIVMTMRHGVSSMSGEGFKQDGVAIAPLVYIVDDDGDFREEMVFGLSRLGLDVHGFHDAAALYRAYAVRPADIVILDIGLEGEDGLSIATHLRASQSVGIIMATARGSIDDRVGGFKTGADAYLVKPIDVRELAATVVALNNRLSRHRTPSPPAAPQWALAEGGWVLADGMGHRLRLTTSERRFLECLFNERGKTVGRRALVEAIGGDVYDFNYAHLDTIVSRLRRRAQKADMILPLHAIRGLGFAFTD
ncbi:response regulator transcription factor [Mesorhizobium retamae]|uniref:Response regulator transcription factor n=1 Tax=Mesorhizobium retamae TaxID=2912854 RepID=A0ABS9QF32_9HYPH|nr:response regulator transcription factor [Mesorhizobium sp. IRAMC:0171]MCG7506022.1 response regulator transcription factor [Mesorhizobium sp. IRAMC:0171]